jgi:hypothetical protein
MYGGIEPPLAKKSKALMLQGAGPYKLCPLIHLICYSTKAFLSEGMGGEVSALYIAAGAAPGAAFAASSATPSSGGSPPP